MPYLSYIYLTLFTTPTIGTKTGPQYTVAPYHEMDEDSLKFNAVFINRIEYARSVHDDVREWVAANIDRWKEDKPDWFKIETIPDNLLPNEIVEAEGGKNRKRSTVSIREVIGNPNRVHPA